MQSTPIIIRILLVILSSSLSFSVYSKGVSPYLPIELSPIVENEVERLAVVAGIPNLTKPYSLATIFHYMEKIRENHPGLYSRLNASLKPYAKRFSLTHAKIGVGVSEDVHPIPNQRGSTTDSHISGSFRGQWQMAKWFGLYVGGNVHEYESDKLDSINQLSGSSISLGTSWAQLDIGYKDIWLSPFQGSAQLLSTQAETLPSISLSNNLPIEFLNTRWNYHGFLAQTSRQLVQHADQQFSDDDKPLLAGLHISFQPIPWWTLGATRVFQFGGGERDVSLGTIARAFYDPRGSDNDASIEEESGNQIASVSSRMYFDGEMPFAFSLELAGEDTSNNKDYQLGNTALTAGLYFPYFISDELSFTFEYSDWQNAWYNNNVYAEGYTNEGFVMGHWAMQTQRENGTTTEGTSYYTKLQWQRSNDHIITTTLRASEHVPTSQAAYEEGWEAQIDYVFPWRKRIVTVGVHAGKDNFGNDFNLVNFSMER